MFIIQVIGSMKCVYSMIPLRNMIHLLYQTERSGSRARQREREKERERIIKERGRV
jgi:hypothetical protein